MKPLCDAHNHLHDRRLAPHEPEIVASLEALPIGGAIVNGTREEDWAGVEEFCAKHSWAHPSFGLHPWHVGTQSAGWREKLEGFLQRHPTAAIGEIGLDRWIQPHDLAAQLSVLHAQLDLAAQYGRPVTIHCLQAWGALWEALRGRPTPTPRGFLLHAYGGPAEMVPGFLRLGAYFSWNAYFLHERKAATREVFGSLIPLERLLVETDAPDMLPPAEHIRFPLAPSPGETKPPNHPAHLALAYESLARLRGLEPEALAAAVELNFQRLFSPAASSDTGARGV